MVSVDFVNIPLLIAAALIFVSVLAGVVSTRFGFPVLLVFLIAGALAGEDGPGGLDFNDFGLSFWVGNAALAVILLDGGLRTSFATFRTGLKPALLLATLGVAISAAVTGLAATLLFELNWRQGMLLGSIVGSTDAAAVFALLKKSGVRLNERVAATLEIESGMNDPMAIYLTLAFIGILMQAVTGSAATSLDASGGGGTNVLLTFAQQFGWGIVVGLLAGWPAAALLCRLPLADPGITALLLMSLGLAVFAATGLIGGSGFLAVYLLGMILRNRATERTTAALGAMDGYAWLSQALMFLLLGLLVTPSDVLTVTAPSLGVAAVLMLVARPVAVWICLAPFRFQQREIWFISWVGLRGAVPIVLAVFPLMAGVPDAMLLFNVAFVVVLASLLLQGTTIAWAARALNVNLPDATDIRRIRAHFGDFVLDGSSPLQDICDFYGLPLPAQGGEMALSDWMARTLGRAPVVGDQLALGAATLAVRAMSGARIEMVGLKLPAEDAAA